MPTSPKNTMRTDVYTFFLDHTIPIVVITSLALLLLIGTCHDHHKDKEAVIGARDRIEVLQDSITILTDSLHKEYIRGYMAGTNTVEIEIGQVWHARDTVLTFAFQDTPLHCPATDYVILQVEKDYVQAYDITEKRKLIIPKTIVYTFQLKTL